MSRVQLALNVADLDSAVVFYTKLFGTEPAKLRPGYANFAVAAPPLKLILIEGHGMPGTLNHLGVEVESSDEVRAAHERLVHAGLAAAPEHNVACCHAVQDKVWVDDPDGAPWEGLHRARARPDGRRPVADPRPRQRGGVLLGHAWR